MLRRENRVSVFADCYLNERVDSLLFSFFLYISFFKYSLSVLESQVSQEDKASPGAQECKYFLILYPILIFVFYLNCY